MRPNSGEKKQKFAFINLECKMVSSPPNRNNVLWTFFFPVSSELPKSYELR
jgi:hypothetical protein